MTRVEKHATARQCVEQYLRSIGFQVASVPRDRGYDLLVNGCVRVAVRVSFIKTHKYRVTVSGRAYEYNYSTWIFNFHHHGKFDNKYADVIVCLAMNPPSTEYDAFVIPWEQITGMTFKLHAKIKSYRGRYAMHRDQWSAIARKARSCAVTTGSV